MVDLTKQEELVMLHIWKLKECTVKDIQNKFPNPKPHYTTLASVVKNLEQKDFVYSKKFGNVYVYYPMIKTEDYQRTFLSGVVQNHFKNSYKELVSFFAKDEKITADDLKDIIDIIEDKKKV